MVRQTRDKVVHQARTRSSPVDDGGLGLPGRVHYGEISLPPLDHWPPTEEDLVQPKIHFGSVPSPKIDHWPPTEDDLPSDDGVPMESLLQRWIVDLLTECGMRYWAGQAVSLFADMILYYSPDPERPFLRLPRGQRHPFIGPDLFVVKGAKPSDQLRRKSWLVWREKLLPSVVIEVLSPSTAKRDLGEKFRIYESMLRTPEYFVHDPWSGTTEGFRQSGAGYQPIAPVDGRWWSEELGLWFVVREGAYHGVVNPWLRWETADGVLLPTDAEFAAESEQRAVVAHERAEIERKRAEAERERAERSEQTAADVERLLARYRARFGDLDAGDERR